MCAWREREREKEVYCKELAHAVMEADQSKSAVWAIRLETQGADSAHEI